jgi:hypothetical protein
LPRAGLPDHTDSFSPKTGNKVYPFNIPTPPLLLNSHIIIGGNHVWQDKLLMLPLSDINEGWWRLSNKQKSFDVTKAWQTAFEQCDRYRKNRNAKKQRNC